jgi:glycosyltransferase involved in cell wall biosynthesis
VSRGIAIILPRKEGFSVSRFGAVALTVEDYVRHSRYRGLTEVLGMDVSEPRMPDVFRAIKPRDRWWRRRNAGFALGCADYLARGLPKYIDVHNRVDVFHRLARRFPGAAVSLWLHNDPQTMRGSKRARQRQLVADHAHHVVCVSDWVRRRFLDGVSRHADRAIVLPNAITIPTDGATEKAPLILFVGRLNQEKGCLLFAEAVSRALPILPGWRAAIIGQGKPGMVQRMASILAPVAERVSKPGFLPHAAVMSEFSRASIVVVPSLWDEPFGRTALEAMAAGCAVIATARGGLPEVVGDCGIALDPPDPSLLADAIVALANDEPARLALQRRAFQRASEHFSIQPWADRLDSSRTLLDAALL